MRDEIVQKTPILPSVVHDNFKLFASFVSHSHYVTQTLLRCLSDALKVGDSVRFEKSHRDGEPSNTAVAILHYPKNFSADSVGQNKHTDIGSLTLVFTEQWGLQVLLPETKTWTFIEPRPGHAVVNIGDALRFMSGRRLNSSLHRIIPPSDWCQKESRYSIVYFLRPENSFEFEDTDGNTVSAKEWHDNKFVMFGVPHIKQDASKMLTGGMEEVLVAK